MNKCEICGEEKQLLECFDITVCSNCRHIPKVSLYGNLCLYIHLLQFIQENGWDAFILKYGNTVEVKHAENMKLYAKRKVLED